MKWMALAWLFSLPLTLHAEAPKVLFGPEFTFAAPGDTYAKKKELIKGMAEHLIDGQSEGAKFTVREHFSNTGYFDEFTSPNGWGFYVSTDGGVIEIKMLPMTADDFERFAPDIQDAIFVSAANIGLFPALFLGGGHLNIGLKPLLAEPVLLRNFLVDLYNHSELFMGILSYDTNNALPFPLMYSEARRQIIAAIAEYDRSGGDINPLLLAINGFQFSSQDAFRKTWGWATRSKMSAVNLGHAVTSNRDNSRLEIRGVRPQASAYVWAKQTRLFQKRLDYLSQFSRPIALQPAVPLIFPRVITAEKHLLNPPVDPQQALAAFDRYLRESGLRFEDHREYLWPAWISSGEVERYERKKCSSLLNRLLSRNR